MYVSVCKVDKCRARLCSGGIWPVNEHADNASRWFEARQIQKAFQSEQYQYTIIQMSLLVSGAASERNHQSLSELSEVSIVCLGGK